ncbi:hypothetical protein ACHAWF_003947 [Thalassiosira exigua]
MPLAGRGRRSTPMLTLSSWLTKLLQITVATYIVCVFCLSLRSVRGFGPSTGHYHGRFAYLPLTHRCKKQLGLLFMSRDKGGSELDSSQFSMEEVPLNQIFQKAVVLQRSGDRHGALREYGQFLKVAKSHDVEPSLYAEVHANMGAIYAMQGKGVDISNEQKKNARTKAKEAFKEAVRYRPSLGSAFVNLALLTLAEGKELGNDEPARVERTLQEARQCCERALGMDNEDERSRALANKLIGDINSMVRKAKKGGE